MAECLGLISHLHKVASLVARHLGLYTISCVKYCPIFIRIPVLVRLEYCLSVNQSIKSAPITKLLMTIALPLLLSFLKQSTNRNYRRIQLKLCYNLKLLRRVGYIPYIEAHFMCKTSNQDCMLGLRLRQLKEYFQ